MRAVKPASAVHAVGLWSAPSAAAARTIPDSVASQIPAVPAPVVPAGSGAKRMSLTGVAGGRLPRRAYVLRTSPRATSNTTTPKSVAA